MTMRVMIYCVGFALAATLVLFSLSDRASAEAGACHDLVGTYLTKNFAKGAGSGDFTGRSLIVLSGSGQASFTDSGEGGEAGFGPFTDGRGSWRCIEANKLHAITLDFTTPTAEQPMIRRARPSKARRCCVLFRSGAIRSRQARGTGADSRLRASASRRPRLATNGNCARS